MVMVRSGSDKCPLMLYKACLDPSSQYSLPLYNLLPLHHGQSPPAASQLLSFLCLQLC